MSQPFYYDPILHAQYEIRDTVDEHVSWDNSIVKSIDKWGQSEVIGSTLKTVWGSAADNETYLSTNTIDRLVCDTTFTGTVAYEGHTISGNTLTFVSGTATMTSTTPVVIRDSAGDPRPMARITRLFCTDDTALALGNFIYGYDSSATAVMSGTPQTDAGVHITVRGGQYRQSEKAATAIDNNSYFLVTSFSASMSTAKTADVAFYFQKRVIGQAFRTFIAPIRLSDTQVTESHEYNRPLIIEPNSDFRVQAQTIGSSPASDVTVTAEISGILVRKSA